ncbi:hypothetical protein N6H14_32090 [Paenibacillus sp. CC-CFT747]|nr:hypothetical protein N6H14_32090 [Paenibacillus sp. CC-CFT747]
MKLFGRSWTRDELEARVGRIEQLGGIRRVRLEEGVETGTEQIWVRTGAGLAYAVTPPRAWISPWLRSVMCRFPGKAPTETPTRPITTAGKPNGSGQRQGACS